MADRGRVRVHEIAVEKGGFRPSRLLAVFSLFIGEEMFSALEGVLLHRVRCHGLL